MSKDIHANDEPVVGYEYDGITEYDNPCPKWLMYLFYATIFFAVFYLGYHFGSMKSERLQLQVATKTAPSAAVTQQVQEEPKQPEISESKLTALLTDQLALTKGKEVYASKCSSCHGESGEGLIGPNLVDNYWLHGKGKMADIANIIISGIPDTGMAAWSGRIPEEDILQIAAYIKSIKGTRPENPREPEGALIEE